MGLKLTNFHVYKGDINEIKDHLSDEYTALNISADWTSILPKDIFELGEEAMGAAAELSSAIKKPILFFMYFEEETMGMLLFKDGEVCAYFGMLREEENQINNIESLIDEFDLDKDAISRLINIINWEDHYEAMLMLEELFGLGLEVACDFFSDSEINSFARERQNILYKKLI